MSSSAVLSPLEERDREVVEMVRAAAALVPAFARRLAAAGIAPGSVHGCKDLDRLPILTKDQLLAAQREAPPFGGFVAADAELARIFCCPGPIYVPQLRGADPWRWREALKSIGIGRGTRVLNCLGYHLSPGGAMLDEGCRSLGATVIPAGVGNLELCVQLAAELGVEAYVGLPSYLKALLDKASEQGLPCSLRSALVTGEPLPASLRAWLEPQVPRLHQAYATAEAGLLGYETEPGSGFELPSGVLVQICDLETGHARYDDALGQVVVTLLRPDFPLVRFGTGDVSAWQPSAAGTLRLRGVLGRVGEAVKVRGLFVHPRQAAAALADLPELSGHRLVIRRVDHQDLLRCEVAATPGANIEVLLGAVRDRIRSWLRLSAEVVCVPELALGSVLVDERDWK